MVSITCRTPWFDRKVFVFILALFKGFRLVQETVLLL